MSGDLAQPVQANDWRPQPSGGGWPWLGILGLLVLGAAGTIGFASYRAAQAARAEAMAAREAAVAAEERARKALSDRSSAPEASYPLAPDDPIHPNKERGSSQLRPQDDEPRVELGPGVIQIPDGAGGGAGRGGTGGRGFGLPDAELPPATDRERRTRRKERWEIVLPTADAFAFIKKLGELQVVLMVPAGPNQFKLFDLTKKNPEGAPAKMPDIRKLDRIWFTHRLAPLCQGMADELGLSARPEFFAIFLPKDLEEELAKQELAYGNLSEQEIVKRKLFTKFEVSRVGDGWKVTVKDQIRREEK